MTNKKYDYRALSKELDEVLTKLQSTDLDVDEAVNVYERGMVIAKELEDYLKKAENKITKVKADWDSQKSPK